MAAGSVLRIAIVGAGFAPDGTGGTETYFRNLLAALQAADSTNEYTVYVEPHLIPELRLNAPNFRAATLRSQASVLRRAANKLLNRPRPGGRVPDPDMVRAIDGGAFDVVHFPLQVINPWGVATKKVLTFMDMQQEFWPEFFTAQQLAARRLTYRASAEAADHIIAISNYTKQTLVDRYQLPADRITVVYISYDEELYTSPPRPTPLRLPKRYFFYPAAAWPHKNHRRLLEAFAAVRTAHPDFRLVLSGVGIQHDAPIKALIARFGLENAVQRLQYVPYEGLPAVYRGAFALVFPSLFEGFGIPLCEAMASGCPVLASRTTSIPEVAGAAARYFDPLDSAAIADAMLSLIAHPEQRTTLIDAGRRQVTRYSAGAMARDTIAAYSRASGR